MRKTANWWTHPQRLWWRRAVFQVHLWVGVALTLYAVVIGLSGSALVFREQIERARHPQLFHVAPGTQRVPYASLVAAAEHARPGWRVASLRGFAAAEPLSLLMRPLGGSLAANYRAVTVNPYTGAVLGDRMRFDGPLGWCANLHYYLLSGRVGLLVSGAMAAGLMLLCLTGLVVWWPGVGRALAALLPHPRRRWRRQVWDWHGIVGFWSAAPLLLLSLTGCYFAFPQPVTRVLDFVCRSAPPPPATHPAALPASPLGLDQLIRRAQQRLPAEAPLGYFALPLRAGGLYSATGYVAGAPPYSQLVSLELTASGQVLSAEDTRTLPLSRRLIQHFFAWHFGSFAGTGVRVLWVLFGLAPAVLALTGLLLFALRVRRWTR